VEQLQDLLARFGKERPADAVTMEKFVADRVAEARQDAEKLKPRDTASLEKARTDFGERLRFSLLVAKPAGAEVISQRKENLPNGELLALGRSGKGDRIPAIWLAPKQANPGAAVTLIVHPEGIAWVSSSARNAGGLVARILDRGGAVLGIDAFQTGSAKAPRERTKRAFTVFNQTDDANRVQDILTAVAYVQQRSPNATVNLVGLHMGGVWSYFARALAGRGVNLAADLEQFRTDTDQEYLDRFFVPGLRKAGDFRAAATLDSQDRLLLHHVGAEFPADWVTQSAQLSAATAEVRSAAASEDELLAWIAPEPGKARRPAAKHD
jgi:hypothetical protein